MPAEQLLFNDGRLQSLVKPKRCAMPLTAKSLCVPSCCLWLATLAARVVDSRWTTQIGLDDTVQTNGLSIVAQMGSQGFS